MTKLEQHRKTWPGKSDEWLFERLDNELKQKVETIHRLLNENEILVKQDVIQQREKLIAFFNWYKNDPKKLKNNEAIVIVNTYLENH